MIYCYSRPNGMIGHEYTDDVAICFAWSRKQAIRLFLRLYSDASEFNVRRVNPLGYRSRVAILTDY